MKGAKVVMNAMSLVRLSMASDNKASHFAIEVAHALTLTRSSGDCLLLG